MTDTNENTLMCTTTCIVHVGANVDGEIISHQNLLECVGWLENIVVDLSERTIKPRCLFAHKHMKAPDRLSEKGHVWAFCEKCGNSANRDHAAAERILSRGLAAQHSAHLDKHHIWRITKIVDVRIRITRTKRTKNKNIVKKDKKKNNNDNIKVVRSRDKFDSTHKAPQNNGVGKKNIGGMRVARIVPVTESLVERPTGTSQSLTQVVRQAGLDTVVDIGNVKVVTNSYPTRGVRRQRRLQSYGFHPLFYPIWVDPRKTPKYLTYPNQPETLTEG